MPPLNEGDLLFMPIADPSISLEENTRNAQRQNAALMTIPEVEGVVAKVGRADTSTDPSPLNMTETIVRLRPRDQWRKGMTLEALRGELDRATAMPGVANIWTMPIINRIDMLTTGIRSEVGAKIFGADIAELERLAAATAAALRTVPGRAERLSREDHQRPVPEHHGGSTGGGAVRDRRRGGAGRDRDRDRRNDVEQHDRGAAAIPDPRALRAGIQEGRAVARRRAGRVARGSADSAASAGPDRAATRARDDFVRERPAGRDGSPERAGTRHRRASSAKRGGWSRSEVRLPAGYYLAWSGRYENQEHARARLIAGAAAGGAGHLRPPVLHVSLGGRGRARAAGGPVCADRRGLPPLVHRLQLLGRGLGGIHRALRHGGADRGGDGGLPGGGRGAPARARPATPSAAPICGPRSSRARCCGCGRR